MGRRTRISVNMVYNKSMKTTIDIPDELYRRLKAAAALRGRRIRDVTIELYERWLAEQAPPQEGDLAEARQDWLARWIREGEAAYRTTGSGPTTRELLEQDRGRLDES